MCLCVCVCVCVCAGHEDVIRYTSVDKAAMASARVSVAAGTLIGSDLIYPYHFQVKINEEIMHYSPHQQMINEITSLSEYKVFSLQMIRVQCFPDEVNCTDQILLHDSVLEINNDILRKAGMP